MSKLRNDSQYNLPIPIPSLPCPGHLLVKAPPRLGGAVQVATGQVRLTTGQVQVATGGLTTTGQFHLTTTGQTVLASLGVAARAGGSPVLGGQGFSPDSEKFSTLIATIKLGAGASVISHLDPTLE